MVRQGGRHGAAQVLSAAWVAESLRPRTRSPFSGLDYGYGWFVGRMDGVPVALARGFGGQVIAVAPERELSVAITSDPTRPARSQGYFGDLLALLEGVILPAARA
jgi:CubicO group peptidase (beta-lactamase class C family)